MSMTKPGTNCTRLLIPKECYNEIRDMMKEDPDIISIRRGGEDDKDNFIVYVKYTYTENPKRSNKKCQLTVVL